MRHLPPHAPPSIRLSRSEVMRATLVGVHRHLEAKAKRLRDKHGFTGDGWGIHIEGALGECALAKALNRYWEGGVNTFKAGDVGALQVRTRSNPEYDLLIRPDDPDRDIFVLVTGEMPCYTIHGWIRGWEAKRPEFLKPYGNRPAAYFVPKEELKPLAVLGDL